MKALCNKNAIHFIAIMTIIYVVYYVAWRIAYTINTSALLYSILLLIAEALGIFEFFLFTYMTWDTSNRRVRQPPLENATVDVFVPTYNEDLSILEATVIGCINMRYPHTTYILDDGHRETVRALADHLGCGYLSREKNVHAKAGNINEALTKTSGEFIVILDADMVPQPDFIEKTLGYFNEPKTAIVQLPQEFYNLDSAQHNQDKEHWHEQQLFYHVIQPGKNRIKAAFWCGSPSIVRREALVSIGGVATESITEDFLTSIRLNAKGWVIKYHDEALAFGIAPQSVYAFNVQRLRWAQGAMKILKSKDNPLIIPGLTISQRLSHFSAIFTYFSAYQKFIYLLTPTIFLLTGAMPIKNLGGFDFIAHWLPYFVLVALANKALGRGYFRYIEVEKYNTIKMFIFMKASLSLWIKRKLDFKVTPKTVENTVCQKERKEMRIQLVLLFLILLSIVVGSINSMTSLLFTYPSTAAVIAAIFWAVFNSTLMILTISNVYKRVFNRQDYRFAENITGDYAEVSGYTLDFQDISRNGISLLLPIQYKIGDNIDIILNLPNGSIYVTGSITYSRQVGAKFKCGVRFDDMNLEQKKILYYYLFVRLPRASFDATNSQFDSRLNGSINNPHKSVLKIPLLNKKESL